MLQETFNIKEGDGNESSGVEPNYLVLDAYHTATTSFKKLKEMLSFH